MSAAPVDVLAVLNAHADGIDLAYKQARGTNREAIALGATEFRNAYAAVADLIAATKQLDRRLEMMSYSHRGPYRKRLIAALARVGGAA